jgi:hypothetical protein
VSVPARWMFAIATGVESPVDQLDDPLLYRSRTHL